MLQVVHKVWNVGVELIMTAEHEKMPMLYSQKQRKLEEMTENADEMAEYLSEVEV